ncbi:MAG TPA: FAD-dependent oxidoreductase, partial [Thermodesulfobacteriota bacterium]|nr:FAD-dependent oxidoreductase [Thermodesulfobacteriota bacterium]
NRGSRLLPAVDCEAADHLVRILEHDGVRILTGVKVASACVREGRSVLMIRREEGPEEKVAADRIVVTLGRKPEVEGLCLEKAGVRFDEKGIVTDEKLRTSAPNIYACGDIAGPYQLASTAEAQGIIAATNAVLPFKRSVDYRNTVNVIFTEPPLASVGLTEEAARERFGRKLKVYRFSYTGMRRAMIDGSEAGMGKFLCDSRGRVVGAHILGEAAPEVIHEVQVIKALKQPLHKLHSVTHAYPTYAQALVGRASQLAYLDRMGRRVSVRLALNLLPGFANRLHLARERLAETPRPSTTVTPAKPAGGKLWGFEIRSAGRNAPLLDVQGLIHAGCAEDLSRAFAAATAHETLLLNFSALEHIDPAGAGLLAANLSRAAQREVAAGAFGLSEPVRDVFHLTRLDEMMVLFDDEGQALCSSSFLKHIAPSPTHSGFEGPPLRGWARSVDTLSVSGIPARAMNINVNGRETMSPARGFGRLWDKKYRFRVEGAAPETREIVSVWKTEFPRFWPAGNLFYPSANAPITPGTAAVLNLKLPGLVLATGLMVIYEDENSFAFVSIQGHVISGWITFSSFRENDETVIQVNPIFRAGDPLMELGFRLGTARQEDNFWRDTLANLARRLGVRGAFQQINEIVDPRVQWGEWKNIWYSAAIRSSFYMPLYVLRKRMNPDTPSLRT